MLQTTNQYLMLNLINFIDFCKYIYYIIQNLLPAYGCIKDITTWAHEQLVCKFCFYLSLSQLSIFLRKTNIKDLILCSGVQN